MCSYVTRPTTQDCSTPSLQGGCLGGTGDGFLTHSRMVLEERLAVMNSIHQSESYTALLSFSVRFCLGGLPEPALLPRWVPGWPSPQRVLSLRMHVTNPRVQADTKAVANLKTN